MSTASRKRPLPSSSNRGKVSRRKKPLVSEDEDSNDSTTSNPPAEQSKPSTPEPEECTTKLPEMGGRSHSPPGVKGYWSP